MKPKIKDSELVNMWLQKYHNTTLEDVKAQHPDWTSKEFYPAYAVTQAQHDEWYEEAIKFLSKHYKISKKRTRIDFSIDYLNCAPMVIEY